MHRPARLGRWPFSARRRRRCFSAAAAAPWMRQSSPRHVRSLSRVAFPHSSWSRRGIAVSRHVRHACPPSGTRAGPPTGPTSRLSVSRSTVLCDTCAASVARLQGRIPEDSPIARVSRGPGRDPNARDAPPAVRVPAIEEPRELGAPDPSPLRGRSAALFTDWLTGYTRPGGSASLRALFASFKPRRGREHPRPRRTPNRPVPGE